MMQTRIAGERRGRGGELLRAAAGRAFELQPRRSIAQKSGCECVR